MPLRPIELHPVWHAVPFLHQCSHSSTIHPTGNIWVAGECTSSQSGFSSSLWPPIVLCQEFGNLWSLSAWLLITMIPCCSTCGVYRGIIENVIQQCDGFSLPWRGLCSKELHQSLIMGTASQFAFKNVSAVMLYRWNFTFLFINIMVWNCLAISYHIIVSYHIVGSFWSSKFHHNKSLHIQMIKKWPILTLSQGVSAYLIYALSLPLFNSSH